MKNCHNRQNNLRECVCTYEGCQRKGICCECVAYHRKNNQIPACFFPPEIERTFDRSIKIFLKNCK